MGTLLYQPHSDWLSRLRTVALGLGGRGVIGLGLGRSAESATTPGVNWSTWYTNCWIAKNAANKAASLSDLVGAATLTESGTVGWTAAGWTFSSSYLLTGVTLNTASTLMVQFVGAPYTGKNLAGVATSGSRKGFRPNNFTSGVSYFYAATFANASPGLASGNLAIAGAQPYRNGATDGSAITGTISTALECYIGTLKGGTTSIFDGTIIAVGINSTTTLTGVQVAAAAAAMAAL